MKYEQVYAGIDLVYYGNQQQLEYDFIVQPGADPNAIKLRFEGTEAIALNEAGELVLQTAAGEVKQHKPVVYQEVNGARKEIAGEYVLKGEEVGFAVGAYDPSQPLVIDPIISWASYVGGQPSASASAITADKSGNVYLVVWDGPNPTAGAYASSSGYSVLKVNASGTAVVWTARIGASSFDRPHGIALDKDNNVYLTGAAASSTYPTTPGAFQTDYGITCTGCRKAFVTKLAAGGEQLLYSTFVGGTAGYQANAGSSAGFGIAVDGEGQAYITGATSQVNFPVTPGVFQPQLRTHARVSAPDDAFVTKLNATGSGIIYSTYLGAESNADIGKAIVVDTQGNTYVAGHTDNGFIQTGIPKVGGFPTTPGAYVTTDSSSFASYLFLTKLNSTGTALSYSTIVGAAAISTDTLCLKVDTNGNAYLAGRARSRTFPTTPGAYRTSFSEAPTEFYEAFVTKVNTTGSALIYSTLLGGKDSEFATGLTVDAEGNATVVGSTNSTDFPQTDTPQPMPHPMGFLTQFNSTGSNLNYSTLYLGASFIGLAEAGPGTYYVLGTRRDEFTPTPNAFQPSPSYNVVAKVAVPGTATTVSGDRIKSGGNSLRQ